MKNFIFKSTDADLQKMFSILENLQKNVLYTTHRVDFIIKEIRGQHVNKDLQKQVDEYFEEDESNTPPNLPLEDNIKDIPDEK